MDSLTPHIDNLIVLRNIRSLSGLNFYIPDYQRGYRWTNTQAKQMLFDFLEFNKEKSNKPDDRFYCLQPVVVKPYSWINEEGERVDGYEVIDGQQRLTTLFLLLRALFTKDDRNIPRGFKLFSISYETRPDSKEFLELISNKSFRESKAYEFIDFYHINMVFNTFMYELETREEDVALRDLILGEKFENEIEEEDEEYDDEAAPMVDKAKNVRLIWYEIGSGEKASSEDIFTRLNIGKIPLTNAELIKAMFLKESNFGSISAKNEREEKAQQLGIALQQNRIAEEWNDIEQKLQIEAFWYFLGANSFDKEYETRIEFIFDLMEDWNKDAETYHTFNRFQSRIKKAGKKKAAEIVWKEVKDYFRELEYWYKDRTLFHLIGFLIECGVTIKEVKGLTYKKVNLPDGTTAALKLKKDEFLTAIEGKVKEVMKGIQLSQLNYHVKDEKLRRVLLLFNILSVIENERSDVKFPFNKYKIEHWDKEHIASQTNKDKAEVPMDNFERESWIDDMLYYFTGVRKKDAKYKSDKPLKDEAKIAEYILTKVDLYLAEETKHIDSIVDANQRNIRITELEIIKQLRRAKELSIYSSKQRSAEGLRDEYDNLLKVLFRRTRTYFNEDRIEDEDKDGLGNMALLNASINRSYGNSFFAIKRMFIQDYDSQGVFIPLTTKNVFMKYYSKRVDNMLTWTNDDALAYEKAITLKLSKYLDPQNNGKQ